MNPLSALTALPGSVPSVDPAVTGTAPGGEAADFSAVLALQSGAVAALPAAAAAAGAVPAALSLPATPAAEPLPPGNILPPALPDEPVLADGALPGPAPAVPHKPARQPCTLPPLPKQAALRAVLQARPDAAPVVDDGTAAPELAPAVQPDPAAPPALAAPPAAQPESLAVTSRGHNETPAADGALASPRGRALPVRTLPAPPRAELQAAANAAPPPVSLESPAAAQPRLALLPVAAVQAHPVVAEIRLQPGAMRSVAAVLAKMAPERDLPAVLPEALFAAPAATPAAPAVPPAVTGETAARPLDFAALVDRLSAAREAVTPQTVSVALAHADFGTVRIQFRPEEGGLAVALANADPDFARAVAAVPVIQPPAPPADAGSAQTFQPGTRQSDGSASGQPRGQSTPERHGERGPQGNLSHPRTSARDSDKQNGIFA